MKGVPRFLWGSFRIALKLALEEIASGSVANDRLRQERGWSRPSTDASPSPAQGGLLGKDKMLDRTSSEPARIVQSRLLLPPGDGEVWIGQAGVESSSLGAIG